MEPKKVGRALGIGVRVASNMLRERGERAAPRPVPATAAAEASPAGKRRVVAAPGRLAAAESKLALLKRAVKAFFQGLLGSFTHAGSVLLLEITGIFFALFALFFLQSAYRVHTAWKQGPEHTHLLLYGVLGAGFAWFSVSSFLRAYRKTRRGPVRPR